jgi:hypothetical protein
MTTANKHNFAAKASHRSCPPLISLDYSLRRWKGPETTQICHMSLLFWFHENSEDLNRTDNEIVIVVVVLPELAKANHMNFV